MRAKTRSFSGKIIRLCALPLCVSVATGVCAEPLAVSHRVNVAVSFETSFDLITNEKICENDKICNVISDPAHGIDLTLKLHSNASFGELMLQCKDACSFASGRSVVTFTKERIFRFFRGRDAIEILLVLKPREKMGEISLIIEPFAR